MGNCDRHADMRTAIHPVTRTWVTTLAGTTVTILVTLAVVADGPVPVAVAGITGLAATGWAALRTLHRHSDGDDVQTERARRYAGGRP